MAPYIIRWPLWRKFENLEFEAHKKRFFSIFLRVVCARKKICSILYSNYSMYILCNGDDDEDDKIMPQKSQKIYDGAYLFPGADNSEENRENLIFVCLKL